MCAADKAYRTGGGGLQGPLAASCKRHKVHHDKTEDTPLHGMSLEQCLPQCSNYKCNSQLKIDAFSVATIPTTVNNFMVWIVVWRVGKHRQQQLHVLCARFCLWWDSTVLVS